MKKEAVNDATPHSQLTMQVVEHVRSLIASGEVKPGDRILFGKYSGAEIKVAGEECLILREDEILGVLE